MAKVQASDFDASNCAGCPHRVESGGGGIINRLADAENRAMEMVTGEEQAKCGLCGCPLANLELLGRAPESCPRLNQHQGGR